MSVIINIVRPITCNVIKLSTMKLSKETTFEVQVTPSLVISKTKSIFEKLQAEKPISIQIILNTINHSARFSNLGELLLVY